MLQREKTLDRINQDMQKFLASKENKLSSSKELESKRKEVRWKQEMLGKLIFENEKESKLLKYWKTKKRENWKKHCL